MDYWDMVEATRNVIEKNSMVPKHYIDDSIKDIAGFAKLEGVGAMIQKAAMDWLSTVFRDKNPAEVKDIIAAKTDDLYASWVEYAAKVHGIESLPAQETGWEMIVDGGLIDLPGGDRFY